MTKKQIYDAKTGTTVVVDFTAEEEAQLIKDKNNIVIEKQAEAEVKAQKATDKASGNQKLLDLGLTQAEVDATTG